MERITLELSGGAATRCWTCWIPPPSGVIKANFDAAVWDDGRPTAGCILRDNIGEVLLAAGFVWEGRIVDVVELRGTWEAIRLPLEFFPGRTVWLEGDALSVIQALKEGSSNKERVVRAEQPL